MKSRLLVEVLHFVLSYFNEASWIGKREGGGGGIIQNGVSDKAHTIGFVHQFFSSADALILKIYSFVILRCLNCYFNKLNIN